MTSQLAQKQQSFPKMQAYKKGPIGTLLEVSSCVIKVTAALNLNCRLVRFSENSEYDTVITEIDGHEFGSVECRVGSPYETKFVTKTNLNSLAKSGKLSVSLWPEIMFVEFDNLP